MVKADLQRIFLIGFMASGKSTIGKLLAKELAFTFIDTDNLFVETVGVSIRDYIAIHGEKMFRQKETSMLKSLSSSNHCIISTGGGMPCFNNNMETINELGISFFLQTGIDTIFERVYNDKERPIAYGKTKTELENIYKSRISDYKKSNFKVLSNRSPEKVVKRMINLLPL